MELNLPLMAAVWSGAFFGALAAGGAGFAFALVAGGIWLHALTPIQTTLLIVACGTVLHLGLIWPLRKSIDVGRLSSFLLGAAVGIPVGVSLLTRVPAGTLKLALGLFLAAYGTYALVAPRLPIIAFGGRILDGLVGLAGGLLGGVGGYSGVLPVIWTQLRGWPKEVARGVYQPYILTAHLATLLLLGIFAPDRSGLVLTAIALPALLAGAWTGWRIYGRLDENRFRRVIAALLVLSGIALVI